MFSWKFCEISKNTFFYRSSLVAASAKMDTLAQFCFKKLPKKISVETSMTEKILQMCYFEVYKIS